MRRFVFTLSLLGAMAVSALADLGLTAIMRTHKMSALEAAAVVVIADALKIDADFVISTGRGSGVSPVVYGPALIYAHRTDRPFGEVWKNRNRGWGEIAHSIGMHPGTFNKLRKQGYSVNEIIWMNTLDRRYHISPSDFGSWRKSGLSEGRILELVARNDGNPAKVKAAVAKGKGASSGKGKGPAFDKGGPGASKGKGVGKPDHAGGPGKGGGPGHGQGGPGKGKGRGRGG